MFYVWMALGVVAAIVLVLVVVIALRPREFTVVRSARFDASPPEVFAEVNDFHRWRAWSPWEKLDPALQRTYSGAPSGAGAHYAWQGNKQVGEGKMTIVESRPHELILVRLEFIKPFAAVCSTEFTFRPVGQQTEMTWRMKGENNFMAKAMHLLMNMDKIVGGQFEEGLENLRQVVENKSAAAV